MNNELQRNLLEKILLRYHRKSDAVNAIANLLQMGKDSTYRRLRGDTFLTPDEISLLARHYRISIDELIHENHDVVLFQYNPLNTKLQHFDDYLKRIYKDIHRVTTYPKHKIYYASLEIPVFFYMLYPELMAFKLYLWGRAIWDFEYLKDYPFHFGLIPHTSQLLAKEILKIYMSIPSVSVWNINIVDNTLNQIEYYVESGAFKNEEDALTLCDKLLDLIKHVKLMTETGKKFVVGQKPENSTVEYEFYLNEMIHTNNMVFVETETSRAVYAAYDNPNFLISTDEKMINHTEEWFKKLIEKSLPLSKNAQKQRNRYFRILERKVNKAKDRIENVF